MIRIEHDDSRPLFSIYFEERLEAGDFRQMEIEIEDYINHYDLAPRIVIHTKGLPHWKDMESLKRHVDFVHKHHESIAKVAIVGNNPLLATAPFFVNFFVHAELRHFPDSQAEKAVEWALQDAEDVGEFVFLENLPEDVIGIEAKGIISSSLYEQVLIPAMEKKLESRDRINCLFITGDEFVSFAAGALWDDAKFGLMHYNRFKKLALVTDIGWMSHGAKLFAPVVPAEIKVFGQNERAEAEAWIIE